MVPITLSVTYKIAKPGLIGVKKGPYEMLVL